MGKVPLQVQARHQTRQNLCTLRLLIQIQKGANPEKAARHGYDTACDYVDVLNKRILIHQRALACLSKSFAHILQSELYSMGNTNPLRCKAEVTHLQPHLRDSRCQELRSSPHLGAPLFRSQLVKDREELFLKKGTPKDTEGFGPYQNKPFRGPHNKERGSFRKRSYHKQSTPSSNQSFYSGWGKLSNRGSRGRFQPHSRGQGCGNPSSQ